MTTDIDQTASSDEEPQVPMLDQTLDSGSDAAGREARIALAAFYLAEARGFYPGRELDDWLQAEGQIDE